MAGKCRFLYNNLITNNATITVSSQKSGVVTSAYKEGTGSAAMTTSGAFTGSDDLEYIVEIDGVGAGAEIGDATFKWSDGGGSWDATGVATAGTPTLLNNGVYIQFAAGSGDDFAAADRWYFKAINHFGPYKLIDNDRDTRYRSAALGSPNTVTIDLGSAQEADAFVIMDHNLTSAATITLKALQYAENTVIGSNLVTGWTNSTPAYETFTSSGPDVTSAVNSSDNAMAVSNKLGLVANNVYKITITVTVNSGDAPQIALSDASASNKPDLDWTQLSAGSNVVSVTYSGSIADTDYLWFYQTTNGDWSATVTVERLSAWSAPDFTQAITWASEKTITYFSSAQTYRYWRLEITDAANTDGYIEIANLGLFSYLELSKTFGNDLSRPKGILAETTENQYGVRRSRFYNWQDAYEIVFSMLADADWTAIEAMLAVIGTRSDGIMRPFYFHPVSDEAFFLMVDLTEIAHTQPISGRHNVSMKLPEVVRSV